MSRFKLLAFVTLITMAFSVALVADALAGEGGKLVRRNVYHTTNFQAVKVGDVEGHTMWLIERKGITFHEKWGAGLVTCTGSGEGEPNGDWTGGGFDQFTFSDGSTYTETWEGKGGPSGGQGTFTATWGTGKLAGIQAQGRWKDNPLEAAQSYADGEGEYTLP
jgi:hypothetical protein